MTQGAKPVLAVDVDDVLLPFAPAFLDRFNDEYGTSHKVEDISDYFFIKDLFGMDEDDDVEPHITEHIHWAINNGVEIDEVAVEAIRKLEEYYEIVVITARHPDVYEATKSWLQSQLPDVFKQVHFNRARDAKTSKVQICQELGATVLIDDHPENLLECAEHGVQGLLFGEYFWNRDVDLPAGVRRVKNWSEVLEVLA